jgi:hypothetical protein
VKKLLSKFAFKWGQLVPLHRGSVLDAYKNISGLHIDLYYDFTNQPGALSSVDGLSTVSWNLCPQSGTEAGKKGMGSVPHGTECFYAAVGLAVTS